MNELVAEVILSDPSVEGETILVRVTGRMTARGHNGFFNSATGDGEPPCGNEYEDIDWEYEDNAVPYGWTPASELMISRLMATEGNVDRLQEAFDEADRDKELAEQESVADFRRGED